MHPHSKRLGALSLALTAASVSTALAAPPAGSPYFTDEQSSHVEDATSSGIGQVNMITCFMAAMKPDALVNEGSYNALVDETKCDPEARSSSANAGAGSEGSQAASYTTAVVDSSRASNSDPMIVRTWIDENHDGAQSTIFIRTSATQPPSADNPYGQFRLDFCGRPQGGTGCMMNGMLQGTAGGLSYYQIEGDGQDSRTVALKLTTSGTTSGSGRMLIDRPDDQATFSFAYDQNLFLRSDGTENQCFSRDASDPDTGFSVWRYGLYDATTGERITRNSGFPIEYTVDGETHHGYLGYWGLSLAPDAAGTLGNGATVEKVDYSGGGAPTRTSYTVVKSDGKLTKYTKRTRTLREIDGIRFTTFIGQDAAQFFAGAEPNTQYELYWDDAAGSFKATGSMVCGQSGCQTQALQSEQTVSPSYWANQGGARGWSQSLGGEVFIDLQGVSGSLDSASVPVIYRTQDLVYPADMPATLHCVRDCPTGASLAAYFAPGSQEQSPFAGSSFNNWSPSTAEGVMQYESDSSGTQLLDGLGAPVAATDPEAFRERPQYQWGVRTGRLFENLADAECEPGSGTYCDWKVNGLDVYYQWETGPNPWNQFVAVKDGSGNVLNFDAPLQVSYQVPAGAQYGEYAGKSIVLQYGGYGDLWGIPGSCVSQVTNEPVSCESESSRYVPSFVIPFDAQAGRVTEGDSTYLVKWLDREIRFAKKDPAVCTNAGLVPPQGADLPTAADLEDPSDPASAFYIGAKPTVTDAPRVIHGDVKY